MLLNRRNFLGLLAAAGATATLRVRAGTAASHLVAPEIRSAAGTTGRDPWVEISTANLAWNLRQIQARVGEKIVMASS